MNCKKGRTLIKSTQRLTNLLLTTQASIISREKIATSSAEKRGELPLQAEKEQSVCVQSELLSETFFSLGEMGSSYCEVGCTNRQTKDSNKCLHV